MFSRLRALRQDQGGQIAFLTLFGAVALVGLLGMVMTTGDQASLKIETQNAADAAALSGGSWIARGLNLTSAINVAQSQLVGGAIVLEALDRTLAIAAKVVPIECEAYKACSEFFPPCLLPAAVTCIQKEILPGVKSGISQLARLLAVCPRGGFWLAAKALQWLNAAVHMTFFAIAFAEAFELAQEDGAQGAVFLPGPLFSGTIDTSLITLPTQEAEFSSLCDPMEHGSPSRNERGYTPLLGYPVGQGPFALGKCRLSQLATFLTGFPPFGPLVLPLFANQRRDALCQGHAGPVDAVFQSPARDLAECKRLEGTAKWRFLTFETEPISDADGCRWLGGQIAGTQPPYSGIPALSLVRDVEIEQPCSTPPKGDLIAPQTYCYTDLRRQESGSSPPRYFHTLKVQALELAMVPETTSIDGGEEGGDCDSVKPHPYLLRDENDALKFLVVARRLNRRVFFSDRFLEEPPTLYTYAQVEVYSGISADTFNQDWRVRLERSYLIEKPFDRLGEHVSGFLDDLDRFADFMPVVVPGDDLSSLAPGLLRELLDRQAESDSATDDDGESSLRRVLNH
jgi:hypothetical protein